jgi:hypothetical protein
MDTVWTVYGKDDKHTTLSYSQKAMPSMTNKPIFPSNRGLVPVNLSKTSQMVPRSFDYSRLDVIFTGYKGKAGKLKNQIGYFSGHEGVTVEFLAGYTGCYSWVCSLISVNFFDCFLPVDQ